MVNRDTDITVLEYGRVEDVVTDRLARRVDRFEVSEIAAQADVSERVARTVLEHFAETNACLRRAHGDVYRAQVPADPEERLV